ncbi:MAG: hypothetical protein JAY85_13955 [Candidatus Thiodiazotropha weberae]|uniref:hypothetical protein n=1 Tax=Candidatus Thiodiazotropha endoloripes TaxID=1818881 RepID=UPI00083D4C98|nr:hypothetical protein [Candidatus Thiodiazotropha endoloripes]MCG7899546.1 hypothetical protein [Candidatus Thiodiazotropha weberae]ODB89574.1 hypothetical protein A3194_10460 [Candidatus Thiodiazotropha endoloripes]
MSFIKKTVKVIKYRLWMYLGSNRPGLKVLGIYNKIANKNISITTGNTDIVIEGFPRSANTYVAASIMVLNGDKLNIARHVHGSAQLILGIEKGIPAVLLIRNPVDAIASLKLRSPYLPSRVIIQNYIEFHKQLESYIDKLILIDFKDATNNIVSIVEYLDDYYNLSLKIPNKLQSYKNEINSMVDKMDMLDRSQKNINDFTVGRPNDTRKKASHLIKNNLYKKYPRELEKCETIYFKYLSKKLIFDLAPQKLD